MQQAYKQILDYIIASGKRIKSKSGTLVDIGITKKYLTEEDLAIERGFKDIIRTFGEDHHLYAEEENDSWKTTAEHTWIIDPISGTKTFLKGSPHYAVVVAYLHKQVTKFAAVYDPSVDELFTAFHGQGAYLDGNRITIPQPARGNDIELRIDSQWKQTARAKHVLSALHSQYQIKTSMHSMGVDYSYVACGRYDGIISFMKDAFPEYAGSLIVREAGGVFTTGEGNEQITPDDRFFIAGNKDMHAKLTAIFNEVSQ